jgi:hypothetical protein
VAGSGEMIERKPATCSSSKKGKCGGTLPRTEGNQNRIPKRLSMFCICSILAKEEHMDASKLI